MRPAPEGCGASTGAFEEQALWFKLRGNEEIAESSWIVAQHLAGTVSAGDNPVVRRMVIVSMRHHWPEEVKEVVESARRKRILVLSTR